MEGEYLSIPQAANELGVSRVVLYRKVKKGAIVALKVGKNYIIHRSQMNPVHRPLTETDKRRIEKGVTKVIKEYGDVLRWLAKE